MTSSKTKKNIEKIKWNRWFPDMVTDGGFMFQEVEKKVKKEQIEELKQFAEYLGVDFEDYLEYLHPDVDFDDYSR